MDHLSRKKGGRGGDDSGSEDDGPPQDPDEVTADMTKKEKPEPQAKEVQVSVRKSMPDEKNVLGGLSVQRRELLSHIRAEEEDPWEELVYYDDAVWTRVAVQSNFPADMVSQSGESRDTFESLFSKEEQELQTSDTMSIFIRGKS